MNRRNLLGAMCTLPVAGALSACKDKHEHRPSGTLKVILNGPFGVVLDSAKDWRITAYVPSDPQHEHELRFRGPSEFAGRETKTGKSPTYYFEVLHEGLDIGKGRPRIDQGFYDFNFPHIGNWQLPKDPDPFVVIDLPRPDYITFTPPAQSVLFGGRPTLQPLDHILEYRMSEPDKIRVKSGDKQQRPLPCSELLKQYEEYRSKTGYGPSNAEDSQLGNIEEMLRNSSPSDLCLLFGVGFDAQYPEADPLEHGINFFNNVLLPSFAPGVRKRLQKATCAPAAADESSPSVLVPAVLRYPLPRPRILQVASTVDCQAGGAMGARP